MESNPDIILLGAGISALTLAYELKKRGIKALLIHQAEEVGGAVKSGFEESYLYEYGPNSLLLTTDYLRDMIHDLGLNSEMLNSSDSAQKRYIVKNSQLQALPMSPISFLTSNFFSWKAKFRLIKELRIPPTQDENETLASFVQRRLGKEFLDYAINPFVAGVYAGDPNELSVKYAFRKLYELEQKYGSLIKGQLKGAKERKKRGEKAKNAAPMISFRNGLGQLIQSLSKYLEGQILSSAKIEAIYHLNDGWSISLKQFNETVDAKALAILLPAFVVPDLPFTFLKNDQRKMFNQVYYPAVTVVHSAYKKSAVKHPLDGFGYLTPEAEKREVLGTLFSSQIFNHRAPESHTLLTSFIGGARQPHIALKSDEELRSLISKEHSQLLGIQEKPDFSKIIRWQKAIPQYGVQHGKVLDAASQIEQANKGLFFGGNWLHGISMSDCINQAKPVADKIESYLKTKTD